MAKCMNASPKGSWDPSTGFKNVAAQSSKLASAALRPQELQFAIMTGRCTWLETRGYKQTFTDHSGNAFVTGRCT